MSLTIASLRAIEILDSRGTPTVEVEARLSDGSVGEAQVPSGASTGRHEAVELRDGDGSRYAGKGVLRAVGHVNADLNRALAGMDAEDHPSLDARMIELDGTSNKSRLGANAILGVSCAVARATAVSRQQPLWERLGEWNASQAPRMPVPMVNILSGGLHAGRNIEFQDFLAVGHGFSIYSEAFAAIVAIHRATRELLDQKGTLLTGVADEGGWGPRLESNELALDLLTRAIERAGYRPGEQVSIALDVAASHFYRDGQYHLLTEDRTLRAAQMVDLLEAWTARYPVKSIEDGLEQDDWDGWIALTRRLGSSIQLVGDDLFTTNPQRVAEGIRRHAANAVLVKMNQIGTLTETFDVLRMARRAGYQAVVSARSGETEDSFLADLAVASGAGQIKVGSVTRSSRLAKYNRLLKIERDASLPYPGSTSFSPTSFLS